MAPPTKREAWFLGKQAPARPLRALTAVAVSFLKRAGPPGSLRLPAGPKCEALGVPVGAKFHYYLCVRKTERSLTTDRGFSSLHSHSSQLTDKETGKSDGSEAQKD